MFRAVNASSLMDFYFPHALRLFIPFWLQVCNVAGVVYGGVWENGDGQKLTILSPDDELTRMFISNGPCASVDFFIEDLGHDVLFQWKMENDEDKERFAEALNQRDIIPGGVAPDGLGYCIFTSSGDDSVLDVGNDDTWVGDALDHDEAAALYEVMVCEE
ncbi:hypothetical protein FOL47_009858 [Perkinsus chesapeaki]|uniref:Uncharacterized protein n=1 Tax=Perkinsus chesapeaki TaxID=330153 RepID=A0A7J6L600_PERCH|nr:hypothetical protein FOL47_009858 [Perkinsus chesapeaki]